MIMMIPFFAVFASLLFISWLFHPIQLMISMFKLISPLWLLFIFTFSFFLFSPNKNLIILLIARSSMDDPGIYRFQRCTSCEPTDTLSHGLGFPGARSGMVRSAFRWAITTIKIEDVSFFCLQWKLKWRDGQHNEMVELFILSSIVKYAHNTWPTTTNKTL